MGRGGVVRVGVVGSLGNLNPYLVGADRSLLAVHHLVAASAFVLEPSTHDLVAGVVAEVPTLGNGGLTINADGTMTVRVEVGDDAVWSDGRSVTGADFTRTSEVISEYRADIHPDIVTAFDRIVPESLVVDGQSVVFDVLQPTLDIADLFSQLLPAHRVEVESFLDDWATEMWLSAGPFVFDSVTRQCDGVFRQRRYRGVDEDGAAFPTSMDWNWCCLARRKGQSERSVAVMSMPLARSAILPWWQR